MQNASPATQLRILSPQQITSMAAKDPLFAAFLSDPTQTKSAKRKGIVALLEEGKFSDTTKNFFCERPASDCVYSLPCALRGGLILFSLPSQLSSPTTAA